VRMATMAAGGRIGGEVVQDEIRRLRATWRDASGIESADDRLDALLAPESLEAIDPFERVQLAEVVRVCRASRTLSEAGRRLFAASRTRKAAPNDADRLRKYLARFGLEWSNLRGTSARPGE
jgi:transcriptional regulatory protein RtcR